jgi:hypothetical protein
LSYRFSASARARRVFADALHALAQEAVPPAGDAHEQPPQYKMRARQYQPLFLTHYTEEEMMNYRALTIAREYGSGGAEIAELAAGRLGWRLVDKALINEISNRAKVPAGQAAALDEQVDPWFHRLTRPLWGTGGDGISAVAPIDIFDADAQAALSASVIEEAYRLGGCVIVGRGSQCILHGKPDVFHVFVYAPWSERKRRLGARVEPGTDPATLAAEMEEQRTQYIRRHYGANRWDPHMYNLMICCQGDTDTAARVIQCAMGAAG